jgi:hypothetical protein
LEKNRKKSLLLVLVLEVMDKSEEFVKIGIATISETRLQCLLLLLFLHFPDVAQDVVRLALSLSVEDYCVHPKKWMFIVVDSM